MGVHWNLITGFPGEPPEAYTRMAELIPLLHHLTPPVETGTVRMDRFSPNFEDADRLGFKDVSPCPAYSFVYRLPETAIHNLAVFFSYSYKDQPDVATYTKPVSDRVADWKEFNRTSALFSIEKGDATMVWDSRPCAGKPLFLLKGLERFVHAACDQIRTPEQILQAWNRQSDETIWVADVRGALQDLVSERIMIEQDNRYLSLAVQRSLGQPQI